MKFNNIKISKQINLWLALIYIGIIIVAVGAFVAMEALWSNTQDLYEHPFAVRSAVSEVRKDVLFMQRDMLQLSVEQDQKESERLLKDIDVSEADAYRQLDILFELYLGPQANVVAISDTMTHWKTIRAETIRFINSGQITEAQQRVSALGVGGLQAAEALTNIAVVDTFARNKAGDFYATAKQDKNLHEIQIAILCLTMLLGMIALGYLFRKNIVPPLQTLTNATEAMHEGNMETRITYESANEIGVLAKSFNKMAENLQNEIGHKDNIAQISAVMLQQESLHPFCQKLLNELMEKTQSQIGAVFLLNNAKDRFEPCESIGATEENLSSFSTLNKEGEIGRALVAGKLQWISNIPEDVPMIFSAVSGGFRLKNLITMPLMDGKEIFGMISLSAMSPYTQAAVRLLTSISNEISARLSSIMASQKISDYSQRLESNNSELQQQTKELGLQADELTAQNTQLELQKQELDEANRLKTNFLSNMSHELRTPLNSVIALSAVLSRRLDNKIPEEEYGYLEIIERNGKNLLLLINDVLDIARIEAGRVELEISNFSPYGVLNDVVSMLQPQADSKNIELLAMPSEKELTINSDPDKVRHILQNLLGNAVKFTEEGKVSASISKSGEFIHISVSDTGIGISKENLPHIFDEFRQADGSTSRRYGGTGLGLAISMKYAHMLGGSIDVTSIPDEGSTFVLKIPMEYNGEIQPSEQQISFPGANMDVVSDVTTLNPWEKTILLVDDNESAIVQIRDMVQGMGFQVESALDAAQAFDVIHKKIPDAMILDLMMPNVDGFKVLETLRNVETTAHIPVLILTAKQISKEELQFLKRNNVHQLIQKGDVRLVDLQRAVTGMIYPTTPPKKEPSDKKPNHRVRPSVLVVEDNPDNMITVRALLSEHHDVLEAVNAKECIALAKKNVPDLILMDIALPDTSGIEAFHQLRKITKLQDVPVIALTASAMIHDRESILAHGFDAFVAKPIIAKEFFKTINEVLYGK